MLLNNQLQLRSYLFWAVILGVIVLASLLLMPFMIAILSAYLLAYMARPLFLKLLPKVKPNVAAVVCVFVAILLVVVPTSLVVLGMINQAGDAASRQNVSHYLLLIATHPLLQGFNLNQIALQTQLNQFITDTTASVLQSIPNLAVGLFITLLGMYYILCSWEKLSEELKKHIPSANKDRIVRELDKTTQAILYGTLAMALLEFAVAYVGFTLSGVEASLIMAAVVFVLAFIPSIGPIMVWAPLALYYVGAQQYEVALGVTLVGIILTVGIETILYAKWIGDKTRIHPFVMIVGVIGGPCSGENIVCFSPQQQIKRVSHLFAHRFGEHIVPVSYAPPSLSKAARGVLLGSTRCLHDPVE